METRIRSTSGAAGLTTREVAGMAAPLQDATAFGDEEILEAQSVLLTFRHISGETFGAALNLATAIGQSAHSAAIQLGKALDDPNRGLDALTRCGRRSSPAALRPPSTVRRMPNLMSSAGMLGLRPQTA